MTDMNEEDKLEQSESASANGDSKRLLTEDEVNAIVRERLKRQANKFADYEQLKAAAAKLQTIEDAQKSETQKLQDALDAEKRRNQVLDEQRKAIAIQAAFLSAASKPGNVAPDRLEAAAKLLDTSLLEFDNQSGAVKNVDDALKALLTAYPFLKADDPKTKAAQAGAGLSATNPGQGANGPDLSWYPLARGGNRHGMPKGGVIPPTTGENDK